MVIVFGEDSTTLLDVHVYVCRSFDLVGVNIYDTESCAVARVVVPVIHVTSAAGLPPLDSHNRVTG